MKHSEDYERSRAALPELVGVDADGKELIEFTASYHLHGGKRQMISLWAQSRGDARDRVEMMRHSLVLEGLSADFLPRD